MVIITRISCIELSLPSPSKSNVAELVTLDLLGFGLTELRGFGIWGTTSGFFTGGNAGVLDFWLSFFRLRCLSASSSNSLSQFTWENTH